MQKLKPPGYRLEYGKCLEEKLKKLFKNARAKFWLMIYKRDCTGHPTKFYKKKGSEVNKCFGRKSCDLLDSALQTTAPTYVRMWEQEWHKRFMEPKVIKLLAKAQRGFPSNENLW